MKNWESRAGRKIVVKVLSEYYSGGHSAAAKLLNGYKSQPEVGGDVDSYIRFLEGMVSCLRDANTNHVVVEAISRGDAKWVEASLTSMSKAKSSLVLPETELQKLDACEEALRFVAQMMEKGKRPSGDKNS
ncbi:MAG: hypothetical protein QW767_06170 [Thermoprotei archaeon]